VLVERTASTGALDRGADEKGALGRGLDGDEIAGDSASGFRYALKYLVLGTGYQDWHAGREESH
jgi:hypothetical protein